MKVLALSYLFPNPAQPDYGIFVYNRLKAVRELCDVKVISPLQWYPLRNTLRPTLADSQPIQARETMGGLETWYPRFPVIPRYLKWLDAISYYYSVKPLVARLVGAGFNFDLIDAHWTYPDILAAYLLSRQYKKPFVVTIRGREALYLGERGGRKRLLDWCLQRADGIVTLSSELADLAIEIGVPRQKVQVILNGVNSSNFYTTSREEARMSLGLPVHKKLLISVGSLIERKGHHEIIKLVPELNKKFDLDFYIIGDINPEGDFSTRIRGLIKGLGLTNVHFVNKINHSDLAHWYNAADLFCLATKGEGCPNVVMEALACGTPVIITNVGAVPDIVANGTDGFVVDSLDQLSGRICAALNRTWDREAVSNKARSRTWNACAKEVLGIYSTVLENSAALPDPRSVA